MKHPSSPLSGILGCLLAAAATSSAAINFQFSYTGTGGYLDGTDGSARRAALQAAANTLAGYFITGSNVTLTFGVNSYSSNDSTLASAGSSIFFPVGVGGFYQTVVQKKVVAGTDDNGASNDGSVNWNWFHSWSVGPTVPVNQFDMTSTAMHELMHAMGFASRVGAPGTNGSTSQWNVFDRFLADASGNPLISATGVWLGLDSALTNGGLFFSGANAVAANGGALVPIYSPASWEQGSSGSHLAYSLGTLNMNAATTTGPGVETLGPVELGILRDIGYNVVPETGSNMLLLGGLTLTVSLRRRK